MRTTRFLWSALLVLAGGCASVATLSQRYRDSEVSGRCYVHGGAMTREALPVTYGLVVRRADERRLELARYPFARRDVLGGCLVLVAEDDKGTHQLSPTTQPGYVCAHCERERLRVAALASVR